MFKQDQLIYVFDTRSKKIKRWTLYDLIKAVNFASEEKKFFIIKENAERFSEYYKKNPYA